jgi:hypothetical protein
MSFTTTDNLIALRHHCKEQRARIEELEVALAELVRAVLPAHAYASKNAHGENDDLVDLENNIRHALTVYALPELGKSNAAEFGPLAEPSTTEEAIYHALGITPLTQ